MISKLNKLKNGRSNDINQILVAILSRPNYSYQIEINILDNFNQLINHTKYLFYYYYLNENNYTVY